MKWFSLPIVFENLLCLVSSFYRVQLAFRIFTSETRVEREGERERERDSFSPNNSARKWNARKEMGITRSLLLTDVPVLATIFFDSNSLETNFSLYGSKPILCVQKFCKLIVSGYLWLCVVVTSGMRERENRSMIDDVKQKRSQKFLRRLLCNTSMEL